MYLSILRICPKPVISCGKHPLCICAMFVEFFVRKVQCGGVCEAAWTGEIGGRKAELSYEPAVVQAILSTTTATTITPEPIAD